MARYSLYAVYNEEGYVISYKAYRETWLGLKKEPLGNYGNSSSTFRTKEDAERAISYDAWKRNTRRGYMRLVETYDSYGNRSWYYP